MYVHIGGECSSPERFLVGVFDLDATTVGSEDTRGFLSRPSGKVGWTCFPPIFRARSS